MLFNTMLPHNGCYEWNLATSDKIAPKWEITCKLKLYYLKLSAGQIALCQLCVSNLVDGRKVVVYIVCPSSTIMPWCVAAGDEADTWIRRTSRTRGSGVGHQPVLSRLPGPGHVQGPGTAVANEAGSIDLELPAHEDDQEHLPAPRTNQKPFPG